MSSAPTPTAESPSAPTGKQRNPVERIVVWGLIIALVALCIPEAIARFGYTNSLNSLQAAMEADNDGQTLMLDGVPAHLSGSPSREQDEDKRVVSYHWSGLLKDYGTIHIQYSEDNEVLGLATADAPPPQPIAVNEGDFSEPGEPIAEIGAAGAPAEESGGGQRGFDPMQADADGDGKLSLDEAPERMKERFAEIDADSDGFVDQEELAARRAARNREGAERPARPERPADGAEAHSADTSAQPATPAADTPSEAPDADKSDEPATDAASDAAAEDSTGPADEAQPGASGE